jgi:hypothetical protein
MCWATASDISRRYSNLTEILRGLIQQEARRILVPNLSVSVLASLEVSLREYKKKNKKLKRKWSEK